MAELATFNRGLRGFEAAISESYGSWVFETNVRDADFTWNISEFCIDSLRLNNNTNNARYVGRRGSSESPSTAGITLMYVKKGSFSISQGQGVAFCAPDTMILFDNAKPIQSEQYEPTETISVTIPSKNLFGKYVDIVECCGTAVTGSRGYPYLLKSFLQCLWHAKDDFQAPGPMAVSEILNEMIYPSFHKHADPWPENCDGAQYLRETRRIIQKHIEDAELSPVFVAKKLGISISYLYTLFKPAHTTINQLIIDERLDRCRDLMSSSKWAAWSITDIAYQTGFRDLSHFSRRFKSRFHVSPKRYRLEHSRGALATTTPY